MAEELGWTITDCLNHKLSFKKKEDPKAKHEAMGQHIKRLRAAGWYLSHSIERYTSYLRTTMITVTSCPEMCVKHKVLLLDLPVATWICFLSRQMLVHVSFHILCLAPVAVSMAYASQLTLCLMPENHCAMLRHALDITALTGCLEREEKARSEETAAHAASAAALQANLAELQVRPLSEHAASLHSCFSCSAL